MSSMSVARRRRSAKSSGEMARMNTERWIRSPKDCRGPKLSSGKEHVSKRTVSIAAVGPVRGCTEAAGCSQTIMRGDASSVVVLRSPKGRYFRRQNRSGSLAASPCSARAESASAIWASRPSTACM